MPAQLAAIDLLSRYPEPLTSLRQQRRKEFCRSLSYRYQCSSHAMPTGNEDSFSQRPEEYQNQLANRTSTGPLHAAQYQEEQGTVKYRGSAWRQLK